MTPMRPGENQTYLADPWLRRGRLQQRRTGTLLVACTMMVWAAPALFGRGYVRPGQLHNVLKAVKLRASYQLTSASKNGADRRAIEQAILEASDKHGLTPELIQAVISVESAFDPFAISKSGACGLMQVKPDTYFSLASGNPFDVKSNILTGTCYLAKQVERFGGDLALSLAAYYVGPGEVERKGGMPSEARPYVKKVIRGVRDRRTRSHRASASG